MDHACCLDVRQPIKPVFFVRSDNPSFLATIEEEIPWANEASFTRVLMHEPDQKAGFHKIDLFHTVSLGLGKTFAASSLAILQELLPGSSIEARFKNLTVQYIEYCKELWLLLAMF